MQAIRKSNFVLIFLLIVALYVVFFLRPSQKPIYAALVCGSGGNYTVREDNCVANPNPLGSPNFVCSNNSWQEYDACSDYSGTCKHISGTTWADDCLSGGSASCSWSGYSNPGGLATAGCTSCNDTCSNFGACGSFGSCSNSCGTGTQTGTQSCSPTCGGTITQSCSQSCCDNSGCSCGASCNAPYCGGQASAGIACGGTCHVPCDDYRSSTWTSPAAGASVGHDTTITISGTALDTNGANAGEASVEIYADGVLISTIPANAASGAFSTTITANLATFTAAPFIGNHTIRLRALPRDGASDCSAWDIGTRTISITNSSPTTGNLVIANGEASACTSTAGSPNSCNAKNAIVNYDLNRNQQIPFSVTFTDVDGPVGSRYSDMQYAYVLFNTSNAMSGYPLRITYTDNQDGTWTLVKDGTSAVTLLPGYTRSRAASGGGYTVTLNFTLDLSPLAAQASCTGDFLANVYLQAVDFASVATAVDRRIGTGSFTLPADANAANALDIWGGKAVCGTGALTSLGSASVPSGYTINVTVSAACAAAYGTATTFSRTVTPGQPVEFPYYNLGSTNNCALAIAGNTPGFYLRGTNFSNHGGNDTTVVIPATDSNLAVNGGLRNDADAITVKYAGSTPTGGRITINGTTCNNANVDTNPCNKSNSATSFDPGVTRDVTLLPISVTFTDADSVVGTPDIGHTTSLRRIDVYFNNSDVFNPDPTGPIYFDVTYTDNVDGTWSLTPSGVLGLISGQPTGVRLVDQVTNSNLNTVGTSSRVIAGQNVTINFTIDTSGLAGDQAFLSNIYTRASDMANLYTLGREVGKGAFSQVDAPAAGANVTYALDLWNGRDINLRARTYLVTSAIDICDASRTGLTELTGIVPITATYTPNTPQTFWPTTVPSWTNGSTVLQPYFYYTGASYRINYAPESVNSSYFIVSYDAQRYGAGCFVMTSAGAIDNVSYVRGGYRVQDSNYPDAAFGVKQINGVWSRAVDGDFFANSNVNATIETSTCTSQECFFSTPLDSPTNGLPVANGTFGAGLTGRFGRPNNWSASPGGAPSKNPYYNIGVSNYAALKANFNGSGYTEVSGPRTMSSLNPQPNTTYFINGNFEVDQELTVAANNFIVFVVAGNMTIDARDAGGNDINRVDGIFIVPGGSLTIADHVSANYDPANISEQLTIQGSVAVGGATNINRSMGAANNTDAPVIFMARPDMVEQLKATNNPISVGALYYEGEY